MFRPLYEFTVIVAGPGDANPQRRVVFDAIEAWNQAHSTQFGLRMRAMGWEHLKPALGADPQSVVNQGFGDRYAALIAVFGTRLGTPTPRSPTGSGTVEEIEIAMGTCDHIMVYFYSGKASIKGIDATELARLQDFQASLKSQGLLGSYTSSPDLRRKLDLHLAQLAYAFQQQIASESSGKQVDEPLETPQPEPRPEDQAILKILPGDNHAGPWIYTVIDDRRAQVKYQIQNVGRAPAREIRAQVTIGENEPVEIKGPAILPSLATADREGFVLPLSRPLPAAGLPVPEDYPDSDLIKIILFFSDFRHHLGVQQTVPFCFRFARVAEDAKWLSQRVDPCPGEPAPESSPVLESSPAIRFGGTPATSLHNSADQEVFFAAIRHALQSSEPLMAATLIATARLEPDSAIAKLDLQDVRRSLHALKRLEFINILLDQGSAGVQFQITSAGLDYALPRLIPNFNEQVERIRRVICDLKQTTSEEIAQTGLARLLIEHVALDFERQGLLKTRSYAEGTMHIEDPSPELCQSSSS
jgi:hypothetical protein